MYDEAYAHALAAVAAPPAAPGALLWDQYDAVVRHAQITWPDDRTQSRTFDAAAAECGTRKPRSVPQADVPPATEPVAASTDWLGKAAERLSKRDRIEQHLYAHARTASVEDLARALGEPAGPVGANRLYGVIQQMIKGGRLRHTGAPIGRVKLLELTAARREQIEALLAEQTGGTPAARASQHGAASSG